jgi:antitoxin Phd
MNINTKTLVSITEANQNFSKVARLVDEKGSAVILKNNMPRYIVIPFSSLDEMELASDDDVRLASKRLIAKNRKAYEILAK